MIEMFNNKNVLLAGGAGFIGANLCRRLLEIGASVWCLDNLHTGKYENIRDLSNNNLFHFVNHDIKSFDKSILPSNIDVVMNFACVASPKAYYDSPIDTLLTSVIGVNNLLKYVHNKGIPFLHASTSEIYGDPAFDVLEESYCGNVNCIGPRACYDEGKRAAETLCMDYHRLYGLDIRIIRIFNTYGPYMDSCDGRAIPEFICRSLKNEDLLIFGDGMQTRSFMYIDDLIDGIIAIMSTDSCIATPINIGNPNEEHTIEFIAKTIINKTGSKSKIIIKNRLEDDPRKRRPDISKINRYTSWEPTTSLDEGLSKTIEFFMKYDYSSKNF